MGNVNIEYRKIDRDTRLKSTKIIEEIRKTVANNDRSVKVARYGKLWYAAVYRNGLKVALVEIQNSGITEKQIREALYSEILLGKFDEELMKTHEELYNKKLEKRKAKALARNS